METVNNTYFVKDSDMPVEKPVDKWGINGLKAASAGHLTCICKDSRQKQAEITVAHLDCPGGPLDRDGVEVEEAGKGEFFDKLWGAE